MDTSAIFWIVFGILVITTLAIDLGVFSRNPHQVSVKEALIWTGVWITIALGFNTLQLTNGQEQTVTVTAAEYKACLNAYNQGPFNGSYEITVL
jgi:hypothetical protein